MARTQAAMQDTAIDPETGAIDMDIINTGVSASRRLARNDLAKELRELLLRAPRKPSLGTAGDGCRRIMRRWSGLRAGAPALGCRGSSRARHASPRL